MATITTDTFLDGGVARTSGETWTMNGARLTIRTDTRVHANAPASMTGSLGSLTISSTLGGGITIDGRNIRWMPYNSGTGNVPAIGTSITQGGVSGYLLGVWSSYTAAPTTLGSAMPASGWIKFREVTGGEFVAGALTGIGASATGPDVVGWMEVVMDTTAITTVPRLGDFTTRGKWFDLGTTTGSANQNVPVPINGGGAGYTPGVWIDDAPVTITGVTWSGGIATFTATGHNFTNVTRGDQRRYVFIQGVSPAGYNHEGVIATITGVNTFTVPIAVDPGAYVSGGTVNTHQFYRAVLAADFVTTKYGTDLRSKTVLMGTNGSITIGHNGTITIGHVPAASRRIRIPNIILRQDLAASSGANNAQQSSTLATSPDFNTAAGGFIDIENTIGDWFLVFAQAYAIKLHNVCTSLQINITECATPLDFFNCGIGRIVSASGATALSIASCRAGGKITDCFFGGHSSGNNFSANAIALSSNFEITRGEFTHEGGTQRAGTTYALRILSTSTNITCYDIRVMGSRIAVDTACDNIKFYGVDYCDRIYGATDATSVCAVLFVNTSSNVLLDGVTFGFNGTIANTHPYAGIINPVASSNIILRNAGTRAAMLNGGSANQAPFILGSGSDNINIKVQRCYIQPTRTELFTANNSDNAITFENCFGDFTDVQEMNINNCKIKGCGFTNSTTGETSVYGSHFMDGFTSDTVGFITLAMNEATVETASFVEFVSGTPKFTGAGNIILSAVGDEVVWTQDYLAIGHTGLANVAPVITGTNVTFSSGSRWGNHDLYYDIDKGAGFGGTWKNLNAATLSAETGIDPEVGFRLKIRAVCAIAAATNLLTYIRVNTTSTLTAQSSYLYPLDAVDASLTLTNLQPNSEVRIYRASDMTELTGIENSGTSFTYNYQHLGVDTPIVIVVHALSYINIRLEGSSLTADGATIPIQQQIDRQFANA